MAHDLQRPLYPSRAMLAGSPIASQSLTCSAAAQAFTGYTPFPTVAGVELVTFDIQGYDVRCRWDSTDPTSSTGHILPGGTAYTWTISQFNAAKFINDSGATGNAVIFASPLQM